MCKALFSRAWWADSFIVALLLISFLLVEVHASNGNEEQNVPGIWQGTLVVPGGQLRVVFNITQQPDGTLAATIDSPDQGATGIPVSEVRLEGDSLWVDVKAIAASFQGEIENDSTIAGVWQQSGVSLPLDLKRVEKAPQVRRPQEPEQPYPYHEEEITFKNEKDGITLAGTLTLPDTAGQFPAVMLLSGSGPQDRNETVFGHRPFLIIADYLTRNGIAVLRYDDRGVGASTGDFSTATTQDFVTDAMAAVGYLLTRPEINSSRIGLIGHSEGGLVAPLVASQSSDIAFIVLLAPPAVTGQELLQLQAELITRASGVSEATIEEYLALQDRILKIARESNDVEKARGQIKAILEQALAEMSEEEQNAIGLNAELIDEQVDEVLSPWFRYFLSYDPRPTLSKVRCPVLVLYGEKDLQVPPKENVPELEMALKGGGNKDYTIKVFPGLNHLFQTADTGSPREYGTIEETINPTVLETIAQWIKQHTR